MTEEKKILMVVASLFDAVFGINSVRHLAETFNRFQLNANGNQ